MKKRVKVVRLPTEKASQLYIQTMGELAYTGVESLPDAGKENTNQHLYFVSDEEIKEGDYFTENTGLGWLPVEQYIGKVKQDWDEPNTDFQNRCNKVIATTDKSLTIPSGEYNGTKRAEHELACFLPWVSESFIKTFVEANGEIDEVEIEGYINHSPFKVFTTDNNEVIVHLIKKDVYTLQDIKKLVEHIKQPFDYHTRKAIVKQFDKWIEKNLK